MARTYSVEFARGISAGGGFYFPIGTVPAGHTWVVRDIGISGLTDSPDLFATPPFALTTDAGDLVFWSLPWYALNPWQTYHWQGRRVLGEDTELGFLSFIPGLHFYVCGYDLDAT